MENCRYTIAIMPRKSHLPHASAEAEISASAWQGCEGTRLDSGRVGRTGRHYPVTISDYERDRLRMNPDMIVRFAAALEVTTDGLLQPDGSKPPLRRSPSLRVLRRLEKIEKLPPHQQSTLLKTIDTFLRGATGTRLRR